MRWKRVGALIRKELTQLLRDRRTLALIIAMPLIELFLFAYAVELTVDHLPTAVADLSRDERSRDFLEALRVSGYFDIVTYVEDEEAVIWAIEAGVAKAGVVVPPQFAARLERGEAQALVLFDGSESFSVQSGFAAATAIGQAYAFDVTVRQLRRQGVELSGMPITSSTRVLYNPNLDDLVFIMPGLVAMLLQILAVNMTAQSVVREYELGTIEQLLVTPARPLEIVVGKLIPNTLVAFLAMLTNIGAAVLWFGLPFHGSPWLFGLLSLLFIVSGLGLGLLVSTVAQTQKEAQVITSTLMLLSQLLTGFIYPRHPMPPVVRAVGNLIPLTYFVRIVRGIITKGVGMAFLWTDVLSLVLYTGGAMALAAITFKKRLD